MEGAWSYFFSGTINLILIALCVLSIVFGVRGEIRETKAKQERLKTLNTQKNENGTTL